MKEEISKRKFIYIKIWLLVLTALYFFLQPSTVKADGVPVSISGSSVPFADHNGMEASINGEYVYCIQRGYPFRSSVSELQMVYSEELNGTIASEIRELLSQPADIGRVLFRGWGSFSLNADHTDAYQTSTDGAPASAVWQEVFDEDKEDDEDDSYNNRYQSSGSASVRKWLTEVKPNLTGHEGSIEPFATTMKEITYAEAGFTMPQVYAQSITQYYCFEDADAASYSNRTKYMVKQALDWGIEFNFITTIGRTGDILSLIYQDSIGTYGIHGANTYSGSCNGYIRTTLNDYDALKLYRQVVWKTTNMRTIPSFANKEPGTCEPIKLYWDEDKGLYTATVSDANGVLDYFDFSVSGCTVTNNGDGTLTISSTGQVSATSSPTQSRLEPGDGIFKLPEYYRWDLEGKKVTYTYATLELDYNEAEMGSSTPRWQENESGGRTVLVEAPVFHSHNYSPACNWFCEKDPDTVTHCTGTYNNCNTTLYNNCSHSCNNDCAGGNLTCTDTSETHTHGDSCYSAKYCSHVHTTANCHKHTVNDCHKHVDACKHKSTCAYLKNKGSNLYCNAQPTTTAGDKCTVVWCCGKQHVKLGTKTITGTYIDWQDLSGIYAKGQKLIDPEICYIKVETVPHEFPAETDTEILLIADNNEWNDLTYTLPNGKTVAHSSHLRVGEKYHLKYIYSYEGASKGFRIEFSLQNKPYYQYNYLARMQAPDNNTPLYELRTGLTDDRFSKSFINVPHAKLVIDLTDIAIKGIYTTPETAYTLNGTYTWNSGSDWNDKVYLDALTEDQFDDNYNNMAADDYAGANGGAKITTNNASPLLTDFTVSKKDGTIQVVWEYDTEPEVFTSALVYGTAYIEVGSDRNYTNTYYDEAYNYAKDKMASTDYTNWFYNFEDHNNVGGVGYFSSEYSDSNGTQTDNPIPSHTVYTQNNEYRTYAVKNKVWQTDIDIKVSNFVQNTGAGITEHTYQGREGTGIIDNHMMNYNLYYTIDVVNPKATIYENKQKSHNGTTENDVKTTPYTTTSDVNEFDVNTMISWGSTGASQTLGSYGNTVVVDHIKTGRTYIQREIPTVLATMTSLPKAAMAMKIYPNYDRLIYEDYYTGATVSGTETGRTVSVTVKDSCYPPNEQSAVSDIYPAMNPNVETMRPRNISGSNNVPDRFNQDDNLLHHIGPATSFNIKLSNGETATVVDSHTKTYTQYGFEYNPNNKNNRVTFPTRRASIMFFKYSKTNYSYNGKAVQSAVGEFRNTGKTQTESYYISQVLFKSNYTSKYKKELESKMKAKGTGYIEEFDAYGNLTDAWIDMVNDNEFAIVSAGQGFELKVTVKYENSLLTQYLARYFKQDDAQNDILGTSNRVQRKYNDVPANSRQYANISALTGKDDRDAPYYKNTERAYISSYSILDRLAVNLVTGSNVFNDLYIFMSDNPDTVYSYSGIYGTPVVFERDIKYSSDYSITTVTYTMCISHENGISSNLQNMKFYTNQLAPDKRSPGIVEGTYDVASKGEHSITIWTPVVAATPFDYPDIIQDRYIGDAIELGYTIKTTGADDSIVHIVQ